MRIKNQQDAEIVLAREFTNHQRAGAARLSNARGWRCLWERIRAGRADLGPPLVIALDAAIDAGKISLSSEFDSTLG